ncbi:MAG: PilZ domain-containing protein [Nitrospinae bacterium]|nr:PilZ domain-containing protein [Nitrospinota bacterium]
MIFKPGMEISLEGGQTPIKGNVRGWKEGRYVLVERPGQSWNLKVGVQLVGRVFSDGSYYGFTTETLAALQESHLLAIRYPKDMVESSARKHERFEFTWPVTVSRGKEKDDFSMEGAITDISAEGCGFLCDMMFSAGEKAYLSAHLPGGVTIEKLALDVRRGGALGKRYQYGGRFEFNGSAAIRGQLAALMELAHGYIMEAQDEEASASVADAQTPIAIGGRCLVQVGTQKLVTMFRGVSSKHVLTDTPMDQGRPVILARGSVITARFAHGGKVYGYESEVVKQYTTPSCLWALNWPGPLKGVSLRKSDRLSTFIPVEITASLGRLKGAILNLSEGGAKICAEKSLGASGSSCELSFSLPAGEKLGGLQCVARSSRQVAGKTIVGVSFEETDPARLIAVRAFYHDCMQRLI